MAVEGGSSRAKGSEYCLECCLEERASESELVDGRAGDLESRRVLSLASGVLAGESLVGSARRRFAGVIGWPFTSSHNTTEQQRSGQCARVSALSFTSNSEGAFEWRAGLHRSRPVGVSAVPVAVGVVVVFVVAVVASHTSLLCAGALPPPNTLVNLC